MHVRSTENGWRRATRLERIGDHLFNALDELVEALRIALGGRL